MSQNSHSNKPELPLEDSPHLLDDHGPVFLLGFPRSGTTSHSRVATSAEGVEPTGVFRKQMKRAYGSSVGIHRKLIKAGSVSTGEIEQFAGGMLRQLGYL